MIIRILFERDKSPGVECQRDNRPCFSECGQLRRWYFVLVQSTCPSSWCCLALAVAMTCNWELPVVTNVPGCGEISRTTLRCTVLIYQVGQLSTCVRVQYNTVHQMYVVLSPIDCKTKLQWNPDNTDLKKFDLSGVEIKGVEIREKSVSIPSIEVPWE